MLIIRDAEHSLSRRYALGKITHGGRHTIARCFGSSQSQDSDGNRIRTGSCACFGAGQNA
jgi:hypothetical protein